MSSAITAMLKETAHRPFPLPTAPWAMQQSWQNLLFIHWPVDALQLRKAVPAQLELDIYDGCAWLGVIPFEMRDVCARGVPFEFNFLELNVRTYVKFGGKSGVYFFSLDANYGLAVEAARAGFSLPYFNAVMDIESNAGWLHYTSARCDGRGGPASLDILYQAESQPFHSRKESLEEWLTERYCLFTNNIRGDVVTCNVHHQRWLLQTANAEIRMNTMFHQLPVALKQTQPILHFSKRMDMIAWLPQQMSVSR